MKKILMIAVLAFSANVFAQVNKTLVYCDYNATPQENSIFMDLYFDLDATTSTYQNIEVGYLNAANTGYPDYLYTATATIAPGATEAQVVAAKDADSLTFNLAATEVTVNNVVVPGYSIGLTDGKINGFDVVANGTFNGQTVTDATFNCYDPSLANAPAQPVQTTR